MTEKKEHSVLFHPVQYFVPDVHTPPPAPAPPLLRGVLNLIAGVSSGSVWVILLQKHMTWQVLRDGPAQLRFLSPVRRVYVSVRAFPTCHRAPLAQLG